MVRNRGEGTFLLKQVQPVPPTSERAVGRLTQKNVPRKARLADRAADVEEYVRSAGGSMQVAQLEALVRRGGLDKLRVVLRKNNITLRGFIRLYGETFQTRAGNVSVRNAAAPAPAPALVPAPVPVPAPPALDPLPGTPEFQALSLPERLRITDARTAARVAARRAALLLRGRVLTSIYRSG